MSITIQDYMLSDDTHNLYDVNFFGDIIHTLLTHDPTMVSQWLSEIQSNLPENRRLIIGLDVEWRPNFNRNIENPVATLQLCVDRRCLIYQLIHSPSVPPPLIDFLSNQNYTFVGIGIKADLEKLEEDYGFGFNANAVDLRKLAADTYQMQELKNSGLKNLARVVLGKEVNKPSRVTMSRWDYRWLKPDQQKCSEETILRLLLPSARDSVASKCYKDIACSLELLRYAGLWRRSQDDSFMCSSCHARAWFNRITHSTYAK